MLAVRCLLFAAVCSQGSGLGEWVGAGARRGPSEQIVQPKRLLLQKHSDKELLHGKLDTRVKNQTSAPLHLAQSSFLVQAFGMSFILDLELNHNFLSTDYVERHFDEHGQISQNTGGEHCYYHGTIRGLQGSWAALSTCHGLQGMFSDGNSSYGMEPLGQGEDHIISRLPGIELFRPPCPGCSDSSSSADFRAKKKNSAPVALRRTKRQLGYSPVRRGQRTVQTETKYIELMVVNDHELFVQLRRSIPHTKNFAKAVVNMADAIYKEQLNTRIVLVAMETWSAENKVAVGDDALLTLRDFMKYRRESVRQRCDAVHLFSGRTFMSSRSEAAYVGGICSLTRGGAINEYGSVGPMAITLSQSLGQNIGMYRNKERTAASDCRCPDPWLGCIMEDTGYYLPRKFSRCSIDQYLRFLQLGGGSCLFNKPSKLLDPPECGNGYVEPGEECDCGSLLECSRSGANCCKKCTLTHNAMCSNGLCCRDCKYELRGVTCRDSVNDCDIPETCTGDSSQCPHNVHKLDSYMCDAGQLRHFRYLQNLRRHHKHCEDRYEKMLLNTTQKEKSDEPIIPELKRTESVILDRNSSEWDKCEKKATKHKKKSNKQLQDDDHVPDKMEIHREKISCSQPRPQKSCTSETKGSTDTRERERSCRSRATTSTSLDEDSQTSTFQEPSSRPRTSSDLSFPEDSEMSHSEESKGPKGRKQVQKRPWTTKEIEAVEKTLFDFIQTGKVPVCVCVCQGRCYGGRCKTRDGQCRTLWGYNSADRFCYEKLNSEGTEQGNCGPDATGHGWTPCNKPDVLCGLLLCTNMTLRPSFGELRGKVTSLTIYHQSRYLDCRGGHAVLDDGLDLGYVEDGTPCGPNMMCLERRCLPVTTFNLSTCPGSSPSRICSSHGTCNNEVKCICDPDYTGTDCSVFDPTPIPTPPEGAAAHKGPSGTNIIIGSVAGAILVVAIILGGTGWGFKNIRRGRSGG